MQNWYKLISQKLKENAILDTWTGTWFGLEFNIKKIGLLSYIWLFSFSVTLFGLVGDSIEESPTLEEDNDGLSSFEAPGVPLFDMKHATRWCIFEVGRGPTLSSLKWPHSQKALLPNLLSCSPQLQINWAQVDIQGSSFKMEGSHSTVFVGVEWENILVVELLKCEIDFCSFLPACLPASSLESLRSALEVLSFLGCMTRSEAYFYDFGQEEQLWSHYSS